MRRLLTRAVLAVCLAALVVVAGGCHATSGDRSLRGVGIPGGGRMDDMLWTRVDESPRARVNKASSRVWLLPAQFSVRSIQVDKETRTARVQAIDYNDLLSVLLLPIRVRFAEFVYTEGESRPIAERGLVAYPFWATDFDKGSSPTMAPYTFDADGVPLLFGRYRMEGPGARARIFNVLWSLGPFVAKLERADEQSTSTGYVALPLALGGLPGMFLWMDIHAEESDGSSKTVSHGPLFGFLGFHYSKSPRTRLIESQPDPSVAPDGESGAKPDLIVELLGTRRHRLLLGGLLWQDVRNEDTEGTLENARSGPLWTMIGGGHKDGRPTVRFLWFDIKL